MVEVPEKAKLAFACAGIFLSFSYFAVLQEDVYKKPYGGEYFKYTFLALVCERGINAAIGAMGVLCLGGSGLKIPLLDILWSGTSQMFAMAGSNEALRYVSYPLTPAPPPSPPPPPPTATATATALSTHASCPTRCWASRARWCR
jgi:UDP-galactose transporter B1